MSHIDALPDPRDARLRHAIAIDSSGRVIGAARLQDNDKVDRLAVMPHERHEQVKTALLEILRDYAHDRTSKQRISSSLAE
ncbi:MAG: GNAT family N-acetyltransferase [Pseudomonadota bacterium]